MNKLTVIFVDTNSMPIETLLASSFLSDADTSYLAKYEVESVKKEKAASLILKRKYVGDYRVNEYGKPLSEACFFNISHSKGAVVFAKGDAPIGIDIEKVRPVEKELITFISSETEKEYIKTDADFFEIWTSKESLVKAIGAGIKGKIKAIPGLPTDGRKTFQGKACRSKMAAYKGFVISVSQEKEEDFAIEIREETL